MITEKQNKAERLFALLGNIDDALLNEAETADIAAKTASRKRAIQYSAIGAGAAASVGVAITCLVLRSRRARQV